MSPKAGVTKRAENCIFKNSATSEGGISAAITKAFIDHLESINQGKRWLVMVLLCLYNGYGKSQSELLNISMNSIRLLL